MIDHILFYADAAGRPNGDAPCWTDEAGRTWMPVDCIIADPTYDDAGGVVSEAIHALGAWMVVRAETVQTDLVEDERCLIVTDSDRAAAGAPFVRLNRLQPSTILGRISPVFAGDAYPFPSGPASNLSALMVLA